MLLLFSHKCILENGAVYIFMLSCCCKQLLPMCVYIILHVSYLCVSVSVLPIHLTWQISYHSQTRYKGMDALLK